MRYLYHKELIIVEVVLSNITDNQELEIENINTPLVISGSDETTVYIGISATSLSSVTLSFDDEYSGSVECNIERFLRQENLYALCLTLQNYYYLRGEPLYRNYEFQILANSRNFFHRESSFIINQKGCEIELPCITFTSVSGNSRVGLSNIGSGQTEIKYSTDGRSWEDFETGVTITISEGNEMYVKGVMSGDNTEAEHTQFTVTGNVSVRGKLKNLWNYNDLEQPLYEFCGFELFRGCTGLTDASELILNESDDLLSSNCYNGMFYGCTTLTAPPELPAIDTAERCYRNMFYGCTRLETAPTLPATGMTSYCYSAMFLGCTNLLNVQESLPATELATRCYGNMFQNCTRLVRAPLLPATTLAEYCYYAMFYGCSALTEAPEILPATNLPNGVFTGPMQAYGEWGDVLGCYTYMFGSCANLVNTPILPAKKLTESCYAFMFASSPKIGNVTILAEDLTINTLETAFANNMCPTMDIFHYNPGIIATINLTDTAMAQFNNDSIIMSYYTHKPPAEKRHTLTQEEINEIVEHYHIHYDD